MPCAYFSGSIGISNYSRLERRSRRSTSAKVTEEDLPETNGGQIDSVIIIIPKRGENFPSCVINWDLISSESV